MLVVLLQPKPVVQSFAPHGSVPLLAMEKVARLTEPMLRLRSTGILGSLVKFDEKL